MCYTKGTYCSTVVDLRKCKEYKCPRQWAAGAASLAVLPLPLRRSMKLLWEAAFATSGVALKGCLPVQRVNVTSEPHLVTPRSGFCHGSHFPVQPNTAM